MRARLGERPRGDMTETNKALAAQFLAMADHLAVGRANPHRIRAYRRAADSLAHLGEPVEALAERGTLQEIPGIGRELSAKITEFLATGTIRSPDAQTAPLPEAVADWVTLPGLSPPIVEDLYYRLGIRTLEDLDQLVRSHMLQTLPGITASDDAILAAIRDRLSPPRAS